MGKSSGGSSERPVTEEERALWDSQAEQLDSLAMIAEEQHDLSKEDRAHYEEVFRDANTPEAQTAMADLQEQLTGTRPTGELNTDTLLRDVLIGSSGEMQAATKEFVARQQSDFEAYEGELSGLSKDYVSQLETVGAGYEEELADIKSKLGTADASILSRETGAAAGGISSAYAEARKGISSDLARRGLAGTGVEASALGQMYNSEAMSKAGAMQEARMRSIDLSDQQREQKLGIAGQQYQVGSQTAGQVYGQQAGVASQLYGQQGQIQQQSYQLDIANTQQGIGNLQSLSAAGQGTYVGSQNYLQQAAGNYGTGAQIAGTSASNIAGVNQQYASMQSEQAGAEMGALAGLVGSGASAYGTYAGLASDIRLKDNIIYVETIKDIRFYTWTWNDKAKELGIDSKEYGVIAQELIYYYPEFIIEIGSGYLGVNYDGLYKELGV